jgi:hypothetical protein
MKGRTDIDALKTEEAALERQLAELSERRMALEKGTRARSSDGGRPLRDLVLDMLAEASWPLNSLLLAGVTRPLHGRTIPSTRFGTLSNDEAKSYDSSRARPVYLCHCLTPGQGQPVKRFWARSDWPLANRIMGPMTGRVLFLRGAAWTIDLARAVESGDRTADNLELLKYLAADQARNAGLLVKRGDFPYADWLSAIEALLERHADGDRVLREEEAKVLAAALSDRELLFGSAKGMVSLPGSNANWRSTAE